MKKNGLNRGKLIYKYPGKIALKMKLTFLFILAGIIQGAALNSYSQTTKLTMDLRNVSVVNALREIENQSDFYFVYNKDAIDLDRQISLEAKNLSIEEVLDHLFKGTNVNYRLVDRHIILSALQEKQSDQKIHGRVTDSSGAPLPGVTVVLKGTTQGTITDSDGNYSLAGVPGNATLVFSFIGMRMQEIPVSGKSVINVLLQDETIGIEEVVAVGYGVQKRIDMTSAVSTAEGETLKKANVANVSNTLGGQVAGIITRQTSGEPGQDDATILLRGTTPLVLVDGIERAYERINMNDVESVSVLKDASAVAPYGMKGANGVILITTKRGKEGEVTLDYSGEYGWQKPTNTPEFMDAYGSMSLWNEALIMDGLDDQVTSEDKMELYKQGTDAYPNTDWVKRYLKSSTTQRHDISISGGNKTVKAFVSFGYYNQGTMMGGDNDYDRYNMRSNVDIQATKTTKITVDIDRTIDNRKTHYMDASNMMLNVYRLVPTEPDIFSNGLPAYQTSIGASMYQTVHGAGSNIYKNDIQHTTATLNQELPFIKGLSVKGSFSYDKQYYNYKNWSEPYISYTLSSTGEYEEINGWDTGAPQLYVGNRTWTDYTFQGFLNYKNQIKDHGIEALVVYERRWGNKTELTAGRTHYEFDIPELNMGSSDKDYQSNGGYSTEYAQHGVVARVNYNYKQKYLVEFAGRYDATYLYAPGNRSGFFPSASVGWRISEENFFKENIPFIDNLKIRASYGKSGNPVGDAFSYLSSYEITDSYVFGGSDPVQEQGLSEESEPNTDLTWENVKKANLGLDLSAWKGLLGLEFDIYKNKRDNMILAPNAVVPKEYGITLSDENAGKKERWGIDFTLRNNTNITQAIKMQNVFSFGFTRDKLTEIREASGTLNNPRKRQTGRPSNLTWGYKSAGLFKDEEDIANWTYQSSSTLPGDIKYMDINGDGKINSDDQVIIGKNATPEIMWGYNLKLLWNGFDATLFFQGTGNSDYYLGSADRGVRYPFDNNKPRKDHIRSWTTDNPDPHAKYPRLSSTKRSQNYEISDFWMVNSSYVRLKSLEVGYNFDSVMAKRIYMNNVRVYLNFYNLWTIHSNMSKDFDSENQAYNTYPQQFITSVGLNITF